VLELPVTHPDNVFYNISLLGDHLMLATKSLSITCATALWYNSA